MVQFNGQGYYIHEVELSLQLLIGVKTTEQSLRLMAQLNLGSEATPTMQ